MIDDAYKFTLNYYFQADSLIQPYMFLQQQYKFIHECLLCVLENREEDTTYANVGQINIGYEGIFFIYLQCFLFFIHNLLFFCKGNAIMLPVDKIKILIGLSLLMRGDFTRSFIQN